MLCQSADNFCVFAAWEELWVTVFQRQVTIAICHLVTWRSREGRRQVGAVWEQIKHMKAGPAAWFWLCRDLCNHWHLRLAPVSRRSLPPKSFMTSESYFFCDSAKLCFSSPTGSFTQFISRNKVIARKRPVGKSKEGSHAFSRSQGIMKWIIVQLKKVPVHRKYIQMGVGGTEAK